MHVACREAAFDIIAMLLNTGEVDIDSRMGDGRTPLHIALMHHGCPVRVLERLVDEFGADLYAQDNTGKNAWSFARARHPEDKDVLNWLQARGVQPPLEEITVKQGV